MKTPEVGMGATMVVGSDQYPYTITRVSATGKTFWMQEDRAAPGPGHNYFGKQVWKYSHNPDAPIVAVRMTKNGWRCAGMPVYVGERRMYQNPSF